MLGTGGLIVVISFLVHENIQETLARVHVCLSLHVSKLIQVVLNEFGNDHIIVVDFHVIQ